MNCWKCKLKVRHYPSARPGGCQKSYLCPEEHKWLTCRTKTAVCWTDAAEMWGKKGRTSFEWVHPFTWPAVWQSLHQHWILDSWKVVSGAQTIFCSAYWENMAMGEWCIGYAATWDTARVACGDLPMIAGAGWAGCNNLQVDGYQIYSNMKNMWTVLPDFDFTENVNGSSNSHSSTWAARKNAMARWSIAFREHGTNTKFIDWQCLIYPEIW